MKKFSAGLQELSILETEKIRVTRYSEFLLLYLENLEFSHRRICDFGCGTGVLGIYAAKRGAHSVTGFDIDPDAIDLSKENIALNDCSHFQPYLIDDSVIDETYDFIISNPASLPTVKASGKEFFSGGIYGIEMIQDLFDFSVTKLKKDGRIFFLQTSLSSINKAANYAHNKGFNYKIIGVFQTDIRDHYQEFWHRVEHNQRTGDAHFVEINGVHSEIVYLVEAKYREMP
ncbi:50S ribosomal protein L11 methyltransferase [uncultured Kiloniella sp.]|uniref:50S ribosomal protein L11 methyltransferase n=1 Tax=uncultured Kiloniella sp. TaxID=1133091 RepID=UPI00262F5D6A|nr:50S ribosomal protein L11 methyltransferase [uncultured Kiloniella sp.]